MMGLLSQRSYSSRKSNKIVSRIKTLELSIVYVLAINFIIQIVLEYGAGMLIY